MRGPFESPSSDAEPVDERLEDEELLLERLDVDGIDGIEAGDDELLGIDGIDDEDEDDEELGIEGGEDEDDDGEELGIDGMPPLLLELCWVDSQPARINANTEAPASATARAGKR